MSQVEFKIEEDKKVEDFPLALNTTSCKYAQRFYNKGSKENVAIIPERKQLIKRRILKLWREGLKINGVVVEKKDRIWQTDFWWEKKNTTLTDFIRHENSNPTSNNYVLPRIIEELNTQINDATTDDSSPNNFFLFPYFASECYRKSPIYVPQALTPIRSLDVNWSQNCFRRPLFRGNPPRITIPLDINMCVNPFYTEYMISLICSSLYTDRESIHFVPVEKNSFSTCLTVQKKQKHREKRQSTPPIISIQEFFVMDRVEGHPLKQTLLREVAPDRSDRAGSEAAESLPVYTDVDVCIIQVLHSIAVYQRKQISHNDLHSDNIIIEQILFNTKWNHQELINYTHFQYDLGETGSLYTPFVPFLIKIIDFGLSCKYSPPFILNRPIIEYKTFTSVNLKTDPKETHAIVIPPNWYFPAYDVLMFLLNFCLVLFPRNLLAQQIFWVALHFPEIPETGAWNPATVRRDDGSVLVGEDIFKTTTDPKTFYMRYNAKWADCITGFNPLHTVNQIQVVLQNNLIERYNSLTALSLLKKCINNEYILKSFTEKPSEEESCIILGSLD